MVLKLNFLYSFLIFLVIVQYRLPGKIATKVNQILDYNFVALIVHFFLQQSNT